MPTFVPGKPLVTTDSAVSVDITPGAPLPVGSHRFELVVTDQSGNESEPAIIEIIVVDDGRPTAVLDLIDANGGRAATTRVSRGQSFRLSGARSVDTEGPIASYRWTRL